MKHITTITVEIDLPKAVAFWEHRVARAIKEQVRNVPVITSHKIDFSSDNVNGYEQLRGCVSALQKDLNRHHLNAIVNAKALLKRKDQRKKDDRFKRILKRHYPEIYKIVVDLFMKG